MDQFVSISLSCAVAVLVYILAQWIASLWFADASLVDRFWGGGFALVAAVAIASAPELNPRSLVLFGMTAVWGLRLSLYLTWRNWGQGEDYRYQAMRRRHGARFWWVSLFTVFLLQGGLTWFISLPIQAATASGGPVHVTLLDVCGLLFWTVGLLFEAIGDWQLARFKSDPENRGCVMDRGLWRYTRHPNYFGDAMVWWGLYLVAAATPAGRWTILSPLLMNLFLVRVSGVTLLERKLGKTREGYADYVARTSAFLPWFPKKSG